jgi:DNA-binding MarR family transcriptional regulator
LEQFIVRRPVDEIIVFHASGYTDQADLLVEKYHSLGLSATRALIEHISFPNALSEILQTLNERRFDDHTIEFSITCNNTIMTLASCIAAILLRAPIFVPEKNSLQPIKLQPSHFVTLTSTKRRILEFVDNYSTPVLQSDISRNTSITRSCVSRHLRDLEQANYVVRASRGRQKIVSLTELGQIVLHSKLLRQNRIWATDVSRETQTYLAAMG